MKFPKVNYDALQLVITLARKLNHDKPHCPNPVTGSVVACQLCQWSSGYKVIACIQTCIIFYVKLFAKHFALFCTIQTLV